MSIVLMRRCGTAMPTSRVVVDRRPQCVHRSQARFKSSSSSSSGMFSKENVEKKYGAASKFLARQLDKLKDEANRGFITEIREITKNNTKLFSATETIIDSSNSFLFPTLDCIDLNGNHVDLRNLASQKRATIVALASNVEAANMITTWKTQLDKLMSFSPPSSSPPPASDVSHNDNNTTTTTTHTSESSTIQLHKKEEEEEEKSGHDDSHTISNSIPTDFPSQYQFINLRILEGWKYWIARTFYMAHLRRVLPPDSFASTLVYFGKSYEFRRATKIHNRKCGYVFLVDRKGRLRWSASGNATEKEVATLVKCTKYLIDPTLAMMGTSPDGKSHNNSTNPIHGDLTDTPTLRYKHTNTDSPVSFC